MTYSEREREFTFPKNWSKGAFPRSRDLLFKFFDPPNISGTAEDTNLNFACRLILRDTKPKNEQETHQEMR